MPLYGPKFPLSKGNYDTFEVYDDLSQQIGFYLKNLILTSPGENISDPEYGVGIRRFLFEPDSGPLIGEVSSAISTQISLYLPYLNISDISVRTSGPDTGPNSMKIVIIYSINDVLASQVFELDINPSNSIGFY